MSKRAAIYARVSTDEQAETGYGLPFQLGRCEEHAERRGYNVVLTITDDYTGKTVFRPGMNELLKSITANRIEVVIIHRTDRLGRRASVQDLLEGEIEARGARVEYVTATYDRSTAQGRGMRRVQGVFDELDYESIIEKLRDHKYEAVRRGSIIVTRPPYGYRVVAERNERGKRIGCRLEIVEEEAQIVRQIFQWYVIGAEDGKPIGIPAIARRLSGMGIPTRGDNGGLRRTPSTAGYWAEAVVHRLLHSERYVGRWHYRKTKTVPVPGSDKCRQVPAPREEWLTVDIPPIVSQELLDGVRARAEWNAQMAKRNARYEYLFRGMLVCDQCKAAYIGNYSRLDAQGDVLRYRCSSRRNRRIKDCAMPSFIERAIDDVVWTWIKGIVCNPEEVERTLGERQRLAEQQNSHIHALTATADRHIADKRAEQTNIIRFFGKNPLPALEEQIEQYEREIASLEAERTDLSARLVKTTYTPEHLADVKAACARIAMGLEHFTKEEKRRTLELLEFRGHLAVEEGVKVVHTECVFDSTRLSM